MAQEIITQDGEVLTGIPAAEATSIILGLAKAEIDQQIATARQFPRALSTAVRGLTELATFSQEAAQGCNYALPRGGKSLTGPSIRFAEAAFQQWGNARVGARVVLVDKVEKFLEAEGIFHDLQTNAATTSRVRRRIVDRNGNLFNDDMIIVTGNAACSIAKRNAVLAGIPKAIWDPAYQASLQVSKGSAKTLVERRQRAFGALGAFGVTPAMIFDYLGVEGEADIGLDHMPALTAIHSSLKNEETTVEDLFGTVQTTNAADRKARGAAGGKDKPIDRKLADAVKGDKDKPKAGGKTEPTADPKADKEADQGAQDGATEGGQGEGSQGQPEGDHTEGDQGASGAAQDDAQGGEGASDGATDGADQEGAATGQNQGASEDDIEEAQDRGRAAAARGRARGSAPQGIKDSPELLAAWQQGYDAEKAAAD
jgi:hypothetical protein